MTWLARRFLSWAEGRSCACSLWDERWDDSDWVVFTQLMKSVSHKGRRRGERSERVRMQITNLKHECKLCHDLRWQDILAAASYAVSFFSLFVWSFRLNSCQEQRSSSNLRQGFQRYKPGVPEDEFLTHLWRPSRCPALTSSRGKRGAVVAPKNELGWDDPIFQTEGHFLC